MTNDNLKEQIKVVADARQEYGEMCNKKKALYDEFQTKHITFFGDVAVVETEVSKAEATLRELTLQAYAETGNKTPAEGVGIREKTVLTYDGKVAFDWAKSHKMALKLDSKAFEKIAKADTPDFVKIATEATATIATNLDDKIK